MQKVLPSLHLLEIFMPAANKDEDYLVRSILPKTAEIPFYKGIELPVILKAENQKLVRSIVEDKQYHFLTWASPNINDAGMNLSSLDETLRKKSVEFTKELIKTAVESGTTNVGLPSGPDPGDAMREDAKKALFDSYVAISEAAMQYPGLQLNVEPLDRYVHKKQLLGPIREVTEWFAGLKKEAPNFYIHWDSAHEALGGIDLTESLTCALPYLTQFHICNCITDPAHPCYGDWHMELGEAPSYKNEGYLDLQIAANLLKTVQKAEPAPGVDAAYCAIEVRTHMGNDMWKAEHEVRSFLADAMDLAGIAHD